MTTLSIRGNSCGKTSQVSSLRTPVFASMGETIAGYVGCLMAQFKREYYLVGETAIALYIGHRPYRFLTKNVHQIKFADLRFYVYYEKVVILH